MSHTPGPWNWYESQRGVYLATPNRGHLIVMDFVRKGMNGAQPRFAKWKGEERANMGGLMVKAEDMDVFKHPDALLIAAAPEMLAALQAIVIRAGTRQEMGEGVWDMCTAAIAKAKGEQS